MFERLRDAFGSRKTSAGNDSREAPATTPKGEKPTQSDTDDETSPNGPNRPPGWTPLYGTYEKPVYPTDNSRISEIGSSVMKAADFTDVKTSLPTLGTNKEHITLHFYTITNSENGRRFIVIDCEISEFSSWLPEEKGDYSYPEDSLSQNGPYYMHLADALTDWLGLPPFAFTKTAYDDAEDTVIFSAERELKQFPNRE